MSNHNIWQLGEYLEALGDMSPHPAAHLALARAAHGHPADTLLVRWWLGEKPELIGGALADATPDEAALLLARFVVGGVDSRSIKNVIG